MYEKYAELRDSKKLRITELLLIQELRSLRLQTGKEVGVNLSRKTKNPSRLLRRKC